jgi:hypothetical protein
MKKSARGLAGAAVVGVLNLTACGGGGGGDGDPGTGPISTPPPSETFSIDPGRELRRIGAATKIALDFASLFAPLTAEQLASLGVFGGTVSCPGSSGGALAIGSPAPGRFALDFNQCDTTWAVVDGAIDVSPSDNTKRLNHDFDLVWDGLQFAGSVVVEHDDDLIRIVSGGTTLTVQPSGEVFRLVPGVVLREQDDGTYRFDPDAGFSRGPLGTDGGVSIGRGFGQTDTLAFVTIDKPGSVIWRVNPPYTGDLDYDRLTAGAAHLVEGNVASSGAAIDVDFRIDLEDAQASSTQGQWSAVLANPLFTIDD